MKPRERIQELLDDIANSVATIRQALNAMDARTTRNDVNEIEEVRDAISSVEAKIVERVE